MRTQHAKKITDPRQPDRQAWQAGRRQEAAEAGRQPQTADPPIPNLPGANAAAAGPDIKIAQQSAEEWSVALPRVAREGWPVFYVCYFFAHK